MSLASPTHPCDRLHSIDVHRCDGGLCGLDGVTLDTMNCASFTLAACAHCGIIHSLVEKCQTRRMMWEARQFQDLRQLRRINHKHAHRCRSTTVQFDPATWLNGAHRLLATPSGPTAVCFSSAIESQKSSWPGAVAHITTKDDGSARERRVSRFSSFLAHSHHLGVLTVRTIVWSEPDSFLNGDRQSFRPAMTN